MYSTFMVHPHAAINIITIRRKMQNYNSKTYLPIKVIIFLAKRLTARLVQQNMPTVTNKINGYIEPHKTYYGRPAELIISLSAFLMKSPEAIYYELYERCAHCQIGMPIQKTYKNAHFYE